jgi:hypothetical protein
MTTDSATNAARETDWEIFWDKFHRRWGSDSESREYFKPHWQWMQQFLEQLQKQSPASAPEQASVAIYHLDDGDTAPAFIARWWADGKQAELRVLFSDALALKYGGKNGWFAKDFLTAWKNCVPEACEMGTEPGQFTPGEQQAGSWQCPKCKRWQMHAWNVCRSEFDTGIPCDGVREQPSYTAAGAMTPDQLREWKKQQAEQGDGGVRRELGEVLESLDEAMGKPDRDARIAAIFMRHQTSIMKAIVALSQPPRQSEDGRMRKALERGLEALQLVNGRRAAGECPRDWIRDSGAPTTLLNKVVEAIDAMSAVLTWEEA